jgi:hypothetical protein
MPDNPAVDQTVRDVAAAVAGKAASLESQGDFGNALLLMRSVADSLPPAASEYGPQADAMQQRWADQLMSRGETAHEAGRYGSALLYFAKAASLTPSPSLGGKRDAIRRELLDAWAYTVGVVAKGDRAAMATSMLAERVDGTALKIGPRDKLAADRIDAVIEVEVDRPKTDVRVDSRTERTRYQSGTRQVENPVYRSRQRDLEREERELMNTQNDVTRLENDVARYRDAVARYGPSPGTSTGAEQNLSRAQSQLQRERENLIRQRERVQRARERLADEPPTRDEPVYSELEYLVETHVMTASATVSLEVEHDDSRPEITRRVVVQSEASDETHNAFPTANLSADPLDLPDRARLESELPARAAGAAGAAIEASFGSWREALLARALAEPDDAKKTDLLAIYVVTDPERVDPRVPVELKAATGIPDVVATMRP